MTGPVVVVGDALLDVDVEGRADRLCPDAPVPVLDVLDERARPGGAALAAALLAAEGLAVTLVAALAADADGDRLRAGLGGVQVLAGPGCGGTAVKTRMRASGRTLLRVDRGEGRPAAGFGGAVAAALRAALDGAAAVLVADYGRGVAADPVVRTVLERAAGRGVPIVWDPHPRGPEPVGGTTVATPNAAEAAAVAGTPRPACASDALAVARAVLHAWDCGAAAVTLGEHGAVVAHRHGGCRPAPPPEAARGDSCGAGDAFAGRVAAGLARGDAVDVAVADAVQAAAAFVAAGGASGFAARPASPAWSAPTASAVPAPS